MIDTRTSVFQGLAVRQFPDGVMARRGEILHWNRAAKDAGEGISPSLLRRTRIDCYVDALATNSRIFISTSPVSAQQCTEVLEA